MTVVVAVGGHAIAGPDRDAERVAIRRTAAEIGTAIGSTRLVFVHGNGPQVGRLLPADDSIDELDVAVAQTQGELGYLFAEALAAVGIEAVGLLTRVVVPRDTGPSVKPIGPGRVLVPSPRPCAVIEIDAIRALAVTNHLVVGGGGGVPVVEENGVRKPVSAVVDKDWTAALIATSIQADQLLFVTDVDAVRDGEGNSLPFLDVDAADELAASGIAAAGSMGPKVASAAYFVRKTGREAVITRPGELALALSGSAGTRVSAYERSA